MYERRTIRVGVARILTDYGSRGVISMENLGVANRGLSGINFGAKTGVKTHIAAHSAIAVRGGSRISLQEGAKFNLSLGYAVTSIGFTGPSVLRQKTCFIVKTAPKISDDLFFSNTKKCPFCPPLKYAPGCGTFEKPFYGK